MTAAGATGSRRLLFILKNGPVYTLSDHILYQIGALSSQFDCEIWSQGPADIDETLGPGLRARVVGSVNQFSAVALLRYLWLMLRRIRECARQYPGCIAVVAHDPLKNGLIAMMAAAAASAPLVVEINGVYGNPENYNAADRSVPRTCKIRLLRAVAWLVLRRAAAVRLLFPGQLVGFARVPKRVTTATFFDIPALDRFRDEGECRTVLFVGYPFFTKGVDILIRAFEMVADEFPQWELLLIGHELHEPARHLTSHPRIHVQRAVSNVELAPHVNRAGIFVLPSRSEAMGRVLLEAAAASKPRIGARVGGIPTVIEDGVDGLLFDKGDVGGLAQQLRKLMAAPELRRRLGQAARHRVDRVSAQAYRTHVRKLVDAAFLVHHAK